MVSRSPKSLPALLLLLLAGSGALAQTPAVRPGGEFICCTDSAGRRACGDVIPPQCIGRAHKIYNQQGILVREVGPPPTAEEKALAAEQARQEKLAEAAAREQRRKDQALLETYSSLEDIDRMQARVEADVKNAIANAEAKVAESKKRRLKFEQEAEFYPNRSLPIEVSKGLRDEDTEIRTQTELIEAKQKELAQIRVKYAEDRRRYIQLSRRPRH
ncbi:hypothetical protein [Azovibrio restrictus]|uniref:hypothetical protein n=1 Tax=Azovibrio restrictus TaxID=146938 RepID=UPI00041947AC|nr:hypothetical protein [Azovibrio restrictus]